MMNASSPQYPKSPGSTRTPRLDPKSDRRARLPAGNPAKHPALFSSRKLQEKVLEIESETFEGSQDAKWWTSSSRWTRGWWARWHR